MKKVLVILNEQHKLMESQEALLNDRFKDNWRVLPIPQNGMTKIQQDEALRDIKGHVLVFASPIPYLLGKAVDQGETTLVLHNDLREKKELPNGKIISVVAKEGWELLDI